MEFNDLAKIILVVSVSFSLVGISIQIMRLLGTLNETVKLTQEIVKSVNKISAKISEDYLVISDHILSLTGAISKIGTNVIDPLVGLFSFLSKFTDKNKKEKSKE